MSPRMIALAVSGVLLLTAACSSSSGGPGAASAGQKADPYAAPVTITPANGGASARPDKGVDVKVANGTLEKVTVQTKGGTLAGTMSSDHTLWSTKWTLTPGQAYTVTAVAKRKDGKSTTTT